MADKKYKVSKGVCLTAKGVMYKEGDEIPSELLTDESVNALLAKKKIEASSGTSAASDSKTDKASEKKAAEAEAKKKAEEEAKKADEKKAEEEAKKADEKKAEEKK